MKSLLVISHVCHYIVGETIYAYGPYALEIDIWAELFSEVRIAAPCRVEQPPDDTLPLQRQNIRMVSLPETGGTTIRAKIKQVLLVPTLCILLAGAMRRVDVTLVRCPGNVGLLGVVLAPLFSRYRVAKYAGQWNGYANEPRTVKLQRAILRSRWWGAPVTVYGEWPNQPAHIVPFFTSIMTDAQMRQASEIAETKSIGAPLRVLFAGRLVSAKRVSVLIEALRIVTREGLPIELAIVGDGDERERLQQQVVQSGLETYVRFIGALSFEEVLGWYEWAHCLVLPSVHSEGWPKVVAEAMSHGLICVAVDHGQVASMLQGRGILLHSGSADEIAGALREVITEAEQYHPLMKNAAIWAQQFTLEGLREELRRRMLQWWKRDTREFLS